MTSLFLCIDLTLFHRNIFATLNIVHNAHMFAPLTMCIFVQSWSWVYIFKWQYPSF